MDLQDKREIASKLLADRIKAWGSQPAPKSDRAVDDLLRFIYDEQPNLSDYAPYAILDKLVAPQAESQPSVQTPLTPAQRVIKRLVQLDIKLNRPVELNAYNSYVLGIEGMNLDWTKNADRLDEYNDIIMSIDVHGNGEVTLSRAYLGTTESGKYYTFNPLNKDGAAHIKLDFMHRDIWQLGTHKQQENCLVQTGGAITISRDLNRDGTRGGNSDEFSGFFGINLHTSSEGAQASIGRWSAGCTVIPSRTEKDSLVNHLKKAANNKFSYILLDGSKT